MAGSPGFVPYDSPKPSPSPAPAPIPPHVKETHVALSKDAIKRAGRITLCIALALIFGTACYQAGQHHVGPHPHPTPTPTPVSGKLWVTTVYDINNPGQDFGLLESDPSLVQGINSLGGHWRNWPSDSKNVEEKGLAPLVAQYGLPLLVLSSDDGRKVKAMKCPLTAGEIVGAARSFKEGKL